MAKQTINIGTSLGDHTGDPIRTAFDKANQNFTELYAASGGAITGVSARFTITGSTLELAQQGATSGQVMAWTGSTWAPLTLTGSYTLPVATGSVLGGVKSSATIAIAGDGTASLAQNGATSGQVPQWNGTTWVPATVTTGGTTYTLPTASSSVLGGVKVGTGLAIDGGGILSATGGGGTTYTGTAPIVVTGSVISATVGTGASTLAAGNDSRITGALQAAAIPAASGQLLGGSGTAGAAAAVTLGSGLSLSGGTLTATAATSAFRLVTAAGGVTVLANDGVVAIKKTAGAATAVTLEASPVTGVQHVIKDAKGDSATNAITISPAAGTIDGAASFVLNANYGSVTLVYNGTEWGVI